MREIKFRAWDKVNKKYIYNPYLHFVDGESFYLFENGKLQSYLEIELEQFTGLRDGKRTKEYPEGQEMYEGDISKRKWNKKYPTLNGVIQWDKEESAYEWHAKFPDGGAVSCQLGHYLNGIISDQPSGISQQDKVIGNIHENADLLKEGDYKCE